MFAFKKILCICHFNMEKFSFQQFEIHQDKCGMKVGTDGVVLGAWAGGGRHILDVGTGTGLIALMMAQRFHDAEITAIDIDTDACLQASQNVAASPFCDRIKVVESSLQSYMKNDVHFDCIVSNPPFFIDSLKNPDAKRSTARHTDTLSFSDLFHYVAMSLTDDGIFSVVILAEVIERFVSESYISGLRLARQVALKTVERKPIKRYLLSFTKQWVKNIEMQNVNLLNPDGTRSSWYRDLTDSFYLK